MAEFFDELTDKHAAFLQRQPVFFVATAAAEGRVNLSPKGMDTLRVLGPNRMIWLDYGGSGNETHAHVVASGRITVMACAFDQPALILRLYGRARPVLPQDADWAALAAHFTIERGVRQIFDMTIESTQTSCGWGVPRMELVEERQTLRKFHAQDDPVARLADLKHRTRSLDGLPVTMPAFLPYD